MTSIWLKTTMLALTLFFISSTASAIDWGPATGLSYQNVQPGLNVTVTDPNNPPAPSQTTRAGTFQWNNTTQVGPLLVGNVSTYCIELTQSIAPGQGSGLHVVSKDMTNLSGAQLLAINELANDAGVLSLNTQVDAAAFQLAVWEIVYENNGPYIQPGGRDVTAGNWQVAATHPTNPAVDPTVQAARAQANSWLAGIDGSFTKTVDFFGLVDQVSLQDQISFVPTPPGGGPPLPEPSSILGWLAIAFGMTTLTRRRRAS